MQNQLFVTCAAGLEGILAHELGALGYKDLFSVYAGVHVFNLPSRARAVYHINYASRYYILLFFHTFIYYLMFIK